MDIVWLDDDSPRGPQQLGDVRIITARTCKEALNILQKRAAPPRWVIVDLIVPQGGWGSSTVETPGFDFLRHLRAEFGEDTGLVAYSILMSKDNEEAARSAGATEVYEKTQFSLVEVLEDLECLKGV